MRGGKARKRRRDCATRKTAKPAISRTKAKRRRLVWEGAIRKGVQRHALKPAIWSNTPHDIQLRLLNFLPVTSRCRFLCVSKSWRSAIAATAVHTPRELWFISLYEDTVRISGDGFSWKNLAFSVPHGDRYLSGAGARDSVEHRKTNLVGCVQPSGPGLGSSTGPFSRRRHQDLVRRGLRHRWPLKWVFVAWLVKAGCLLGVWAETHEVLLYGGRNHNSLLLQDDRLYFLTLSSFNIRSLKSVNIWDPEHTCKTLATWTDLSLRLHQNGYQSFCDYNHPSLISCQGKIMLVNMIHTPIPGDAIGFVYLDEESGRWRELKTFPVVAFPARVMERNLKHEGKGYVWAAGSRESSKVALFFVRAWWGCVFDVADSTWRGEGG